MEDTLWQGLTDSLCNVRLPPPVWRVSLDPKPRR